MTCSGWAHSKGRRCCNRIAKENRELATEIMEDMSVLDVRSTNFNAVLKSLAKPLLCRAYHVKDPDQHTSLRREWKKDIEAYKVTINARRTTTTTTTGPALITVESLQEELDSLRATMTLLMQRTAEAARVEHVPSLVAPTASSQTSRVEQATNSANETPSPRIHRAQPVTPVSRQRDQNVASANPTSSPQDRASGEGWHPQQGPSTSPCPNEHTETVSMPPATRPPPDITARDHHHETVPSATSRTSPSNTEQPSAGGGRSRQEATNGRRAIEGNCSICFEDLRGGENLSWCKAQCGQNFHAECVGVWLATLTEGHRTCPYW